MEPVVGRDPAAPLSSAAAKSPESTNPVAESTGGPSKPADPGLASQLQHNLVATLAQPAPDPYNERLRQQASMPPSALPQPIPPSAVPRAVDPTAWLPETAPSPLYRPPIKETKREEEIHVLYDRKVCVKPDEDGSVYSLCRRWLLNDPSLKIPDKRPLPALPPTLPPPLPREPAAPAPTPSDLGESGSDTSHLNNEEENLPDINDLIEHNKNHWKRVREHWQGEYRKKVRRFAHRVSMLLPPMPSPTDRTDAPEEVSPNNR